MAIMQPYFFPYIGYFQLINSVDLFVIYDDVSYIKRSWINRNYILINGKKHLFTLELSGPRYMKAINEISVGGNDPELSKKIYYAYKRAPYFGEVYPLIEKIIENKEHNLAEYVSASIFQLCEYLNIKTSIYRSSNIEMNADLKGQERIIHICKLFGASSYINAIGGMKLYEQDQFLLQGISLYFLRTMNFEYKQFSNEHIPNLSIIDVLMFNGRGKTADLLTKYELL